MPSVGVQENPKILCGLNNNGEQRDVARAIYLRKINLQAIPWGRNAAERRWNLSYRELPKTMAFDIDETKTEAFAALFGPHYRCYQIFDALDIPPPLVVTINPVTLNCQYIYEMRWTEADRAKPQAAKREYEALRRRLSVLFGGDPRFGNHVVRSPFFIAGHHRNHPDAATRSRKRIDVENDSLFHYSIWYQPHGYSLADLRELVRYLEELHGPNAPATPAELSTPAGSDPKTYAGPNGNRLPISQQLSYAGRDPRTVAVGERNVFIFSCAAVKCRRMATRFRDRAGDYAGFMAAVLPGLLETNARLGSPLDEKEVRNSVSSAVRYCLSDRYRPLGRISAEARFISLNFRWKFHVSVADKAKAMGISVSTFYRRGYHKKHDLVASRVRAARSHPELLVSGAVVHRPNTYGGLFPRKKKVVALVNGVYLPQTTTHERHSLTRNQHARVAIGKTRYHPPD